MRVKLTYLVEVPCFFAHASQAKPGGNARSGSAVMSHDEAKKILGTPCDPYILDFWQIVDESEVMEKIKTVNDLGHEVEVEYLNE